MSEDVQKTNEGAEANLKVNSNCSVFCLRSLKSTVVLVRGPTIPRPQPWGGGNYRSHFLTAYSMSLSKLRELQSGFAAFPQKKDNLCDKKCSSFHVENVSTSG